jgi:hypothetical protein
METQVSVGSCDLTPFVCGPGSGHVGPSETMIPVIVFRDTSFRDTSSWHTDLALSLAAIKKCIEWRLQVQIAFSTEVDLAPSRPE